jgi:acyl dehydratase
MAFSHPINDRYFEDYVEGDVHAFGSIFVDGDEVVSFAKRFDPQVFHTDPEAAKCTAFWRAHRQRLAHRRTHDAALF